MNPATPTTGPGEPPLRPAGKPTPGLTPDDTAAFEFITGERVPDDELLRIICERIRVAAQCLGLSREDLFQMFGSYSLLEADVAVPVDGALETFPLVEAHHRIQGKVGKGALKVLLPRDLIRESPRFVEATPRVAEVLPPGPGTRWDGPEAAWAAVRQFLRELIAGETLSMSLKSQTTGTPFAGSEGVLLCARGDYDGATGRFFLRPVLAGTDAGKARDKEILEALMNAAAELLTRTGRIAHDRIVHAAETNSTLTARLDLQLPTNVVEGHLRALLASDPDIVIGDEDMTRRLRRLLARPDYRPTACALATEAARLQLDHSILTLASRERLRRVLAALPPAGTPTPEQFRDLVTLFFGSGETQQTEDQIFHHREPILKSLSAALSAGPLDGCDDPQVLALYLRTLLDNPVKLMKAALLKRLPPEEALPVDWVRRWLLFSPEQEAELAGLLPPEGARGEAVRGRFLRVREILTRLEDELASAGDDLYPAARREVIGLARRALMTGGGILPSVDRIRFFTVPFSYECVTPKLGVVTRKPLAVCGSELRPEAMAAGAVFAMEVLLKSRGSGRGRPLDGLTVAIQGLGNAGKGIARMLQQRGARIVAVSDSRGALIAPTGLSDADLAALLEHKSAGRRLDTFVLPETARPEGAPSGPRVVLHRNPDVLKTVKADVLVLTAKAASITAADVPALHCGVICEVTGAAVAAEAKPALLQRAILLIPDNLGSSGGLLVSLSEMLQNSFGQQWEWSLEETALRQQIEQSHDAVLKMTKKHGVDFATGSDLLALKRIHALAIYRQNLHAAAQTLREEIEAIEDGETVLIVSDDDDDGVASAAILRGLIARLNPGREQQILYVNESLRSRAVLDVIEAKEKAGARVRRVFVLDRAFPLAAAGQQFTAEMARRCRVTLINNHELPARVLEAGPLGPLKDKPGPVPSPAEMGVRLISPQTLKSTLSSRHCTTALILRELAHQLLTDAPTLQRMDWQAAIGSCLDVPPEATPEWLLFYAPFNPDAMFEAARAVRMVARAHGFMSAIQAVEGVTRPDELETNKPWEQFLNTYRVLAERVHLLVEKIVMENVGRPYVSHFFNTAEVASPVRLAPGDTRCLDLYPWMSEFLTQRADYAQKPIIVGQVIRDLLQREFLGVRIRSPRDVELMEAGLPEGFRTGGLPNTAVAKIPLDPARPPEQQFHELVENIWWKTVSPTVRLKKPKAPPTPS